MQKKLTITIDEAVYEGLYRVVGPGQISRFIEDLVRPHVTRPDLAAEYARMAADRRREDEALIWCEADLHDADADFDDAEGMSELRRKAGLGLSGGMGETT